MKQIPIAELIPGMVTAEDILIHNQKTLIPKGVVLTENIISRLEGYSIYYANIEDNLKNDFLQGLSSPMVAVNQNAFTADFPLAPLEDRKSVV